VGEIPGPIIITVQHIIGERKMSSDKVRKRLWRETFNYAGEVFTFYKRAHNKSSAFQLGVVEMARRKGLSVWAVRQYFNGSKDNFEVREETCIKKSS